MVDGRSGLGHWRVLDLKGFASGWFHNRGHVSLWERLLQLGVRFLDQGGCRCAVEAKTRYAPAS